jgi:hypothetical protein
VPQPAGERTCLNCAGMTGVISGAVLVAVFCAVAVGCLLLVLTLFRVGKRDGHG